MDSALDQSAAQTQAKSDSPSFFRVLLFVAGATVLAIAIGFLITGLILMGYATDWSGFGEYVTQSGDVERGKTLWDWMELLLLPLIVASTAIVLATWKWRSDRRQAALELESEREIAWRKVEAELQMSDLRQESHREAAEIQSRTNRVIAKDRLHEESLNSYLDRMSMLVLEQGLQSSDPNDKVRLVARARTLTALVGLDSERKGTILEFLYAAKLINLSDPLGELMLQVDLVDAKRPPVDLTQADFSGAYLVATSLRGADLQGVDFRMADFRAADLSGANLRAADLTDADLSGARLVQVNLREANLKDADLRSADLTGAVLQGAQMVGAQLGETDMGKSDLTAAALTTQQLKQAKSLEGATLRDGTKSE